MSRNSFFCSKFAPMLQELFSIYIPIAVALTVIYVFIIATYRKGWQSLPQFISPSNHTISTKITVIVPARDEEDNILECIHSILNQTIDKDLFEIIVIDDHSTDSTPDLIRGLKNERVKLLPLVDYITEGETQSFKKKAIEIAMQQATGDLIVTTDADCIVTENWLELVATFYETRDVKFIAAPVLFHREKNTLQRFQTLDFFGMMCVTGAGIHTGLMNMCNGANLAYEKKAFYDVNGFEGINHLASGDDMLLMQKIAEKYPKKIGFLKNQEAIVRTEAKETLQGFMSQRIRWATKSTSYQEWQVTAILAMVFFCCCSTVFTFFLIPFFGIPAFQLFLFQFIIKSIPDFIYLNMMAKWFKKPEAMRGFFISEIMHILYIVSVGTAGNFFKEYEWKGRKVK